MKALLTLAQAAPLLGCRDARTARKRLALLGVPVLQLAGRVLVDEGDLLRARRAQARPLVAEAPTDPTGVRLTTGARLWDGPENQVAPRRANARGRGDRGVSPGAPPAYPAPPAAPGTRSTSRSPRRTEEA